MTWDERLMWGYAIDELNEEQERARKLREGKRAPDEDDINS